MGVLGVHDPRSFKQTLLCVYLSETNEAPTSCVVLVEVHWLRNRWIRWCWRHAHSKPRWKQWWRAATR